MSVLTPNDYHRLHKDLRSAVETWLTGVGLTLNDVTEVEMSASWQGSPVVKVTTINRDEQGKPYLFPNGVPSTTIHSFDGDGWPL